MRSAAARSFSFDSAPKPYRGSMLAPTAKTQRFLKVTQVLLTFLSVCAVADSSRADRPPTDRPGYHAGAQQREAARDRRFGDLARTERKRREAEQQANRRSAARTAAVRLSSSARAADEAGFEPTGRGIRPATDLETLFAIEALQHHTAQSFAVRCPWHASCTAWLEPGNGSTA